MTARTKHPTQSQVIDKLTAAFDTAHARAKSLIDRQDEIVRGLGRIQKLLKLGAGDAAVTEMESLLATDLKQAQERVYNQDSGLRIAIQCLTAQSERKWKEVSDTSGPEDATPNEKGLLRYVGESNEDASTALSQIRALVPSAFEPAPTPEGVS